MYLVGAAHPHKADARRLLERAIAERQRLVTDAEVLQEVIHRYAAIGRREAIQPAFEALLGVVDEVFPVDLGAVSRARDVVLGYPGISARDAIHLAIMEREGIAEIVTFDTGFDSYPGIRRIST